jgi:LPXTG-motif cell wall-anchored protein
MKRQIFVLLTALVVATGTTLWAQSTAPLPNSQQVDQSGQPETGPGPDVDVDAGRNAEDGMVDVDVNRRTDADTAAQGNDTMTNDSMNTTVGGTADDLPDTGSATPLAGLAGLLALAAGLALRAQR